MAHLVLIWTSFVSEWHYQAYWMEPHLALALLPGFGAALLHHWKGRRLWPWWLGVAAVLALLPNAPYVLTDIAHLRANIVTAPTSADARYGVIPIFALFMLTGLASYAYCIHILRVELRRRGWSRARRVLAALTVDTACAIGVGLGRIPRLNSWDVIHPHALLAGLAQVANYPVELGLLLVIIIAGRVVLDRLSLSASHALRVALQHR